MVATTVPPGDFFHSFGIRFGYVLEVVFSNLDKFLLGWPFAALLGLPIAYDMAIRRKLYVEFIAWAVLCGCVIILPMVIIDSFQYGRVTIAPFNILWYNVFGGAGPNLYGTEPFSFYLINGFVNFNFVWVSICSVRVVNNFGSRFWRC